MNGYEISGWQKHEKVLELAELLEDSFPCYDGTGEVPGQIHGCLSSNFHELRGLGREDPALLMYYDNALMRTEG